MPRKNKISKKHALHFIVILGFVSLFADITYEGARSITGPYLAILGASGTAVGIIAGLGELIGYGVRVLTGYISDQTRRYWAITIFGYALNLIAVPLLAFAGSWQMAGFLIILERFGKAIRTPARDTIISFATKQVGRGLGFGIHEFLDRMGAVLGPLIMTLALAFREDYRIGFKILFLPAFIAIVILLYAKWMVPSPEKLESNTPLLHPKVLRRNFWIYLLAVGLVAAGYIDFALIAYHFQKASTLSVIWIPLIYTIAMLFDGITSLFIGRLFDKKGVFILAIVIAVASVFAPLVFFGTAIGASIGVLLWGIGMGAQTTITRAMIPYLVSPEKRGTAYGIFNLSFGLFWFAGSAVMGILYDISLIYLVGFSLVFQLASIPLFFMIQLKPKSN